MPCAVMRVWVQMMSTADSCTIKSHACYFSQSEMRTWLVTTSPCDQSTNVNVSTCIFAIAQRADAIHHA